MNGKANASQNQKSTSQIKSDKMKHIYLCPRTDNEPNHINKN